MNIGLVPDGGAVALISTRVGAGRATQMALLNERVPASDLRRWGLVNDVLPDHEFEEFVHETLDRLATGPTRSYAGTKRQINEWMYAGLDAQLEFEAGIQQEMARSADFREGVTAFLEKRPPRFTGE